MPPSPVKEGRPLPIAAAIRLRRSLVATAFVVATIPASLSGTQAIERRWLPEPVLTATFVDEDGTAFGDPQRIVALPDGGFAVADRDQNSIRAFLADGSPGWTFGRAGSGPGEFRFLQDLDVSAQGEVLVLDRGLGRATIIDARTGRLVTSFRILTAGQYGILPSSGAGRVLVIPESEKEKTLWVAVTEDGAAVESAPMPLACAHSLACEAYTAATGSVGAAVALRWSSKVILLDPDGAVRSIVDGIEALPIPQVTTESVTPPSGLGFTAMRVTRVDRSAGQATAGLTGDESNLYLLSAGSDEEHRRIVDVYSVATGDYRGSLRFPAAVADLAILSDGRLATLELEYFPTVHVWTLPG